MAKWIIRRVSLDEKVLVVVKHRPGHNCPTAWIVVLLVLWDGIPEQEADDLYSMLVPKLYKYVFVFVVDKSTESLSLCDSLLSPGMVGSILNVDAPLTN